LCRSADLPNSERSKRKFTDVALVLPGKREPTHLEVFVQSFFEFLAKAGPDGKCKKTTMCDHVSRDANEGAEGINRGREGGIASMYIQSLISPKNLQ
jgi:hypothetical protein